MTHVSVKSELMLSSNPCPNFRGGHVCNRDYGSRFGAAGKAKKTGEGLRINRFETRILDKHGDSLKGLDGLAMLLVDVDYDGKIFDMDRTVFAKDISDDGEIKVTGLTENIAVIAIDKHGNESKLIIV